jgi:hypothetical protein
MIDLAGLYRELMNADNRAFVEQIKKAQEIEKQELEAQADCECNGGGFTYCEICHGE